MAIDQLDVVDSIGADPNGSDAYLIIADHLVWGASEEEDKRHMYMLQEKINTYLRFIESGEIYETYPQSKDKKLIIRVVGKHDMNVGGKNCFGKIETSLISSGYAVTFERMQT